MPSRGFYAFQISTEGVIAFLIVLFFNPTALRGKIREFDIVADGLRSPFTPEIQSAIVVALLLVFGVLIFASVFPTFYKDMLEAHQTSS